GERAGFLVAASADATTRAEVESLLRAHQDSPSFLDGAAGDLVGLAAGAAAGEVAEEALGTRIGSYELLRLLGRGGMGTVYLAERGDGFHRQVALKLIARSLPSPALVRRFER